MKFYLVGIKGTGMSALANILVDLSHEVYGVDYNKKYFTEATFRKSIVVENFENINLKEEYFYIIGNAFKIHEITNKIKELGYQYNYYPEFIENFFKMKKIGVSGTHGKTTTTSFISQVLKEKTNSLIGDGTGYGYKKAKYFLFEACEYQNHFLKYNFDFLVILNIDYDHPDYFKNSAEYISSFQKAALNSKLLIVNGDDLNCQKIIHKNKITFGFSPNCDVWIRQIDKKIILTFLEDEYSFDFNFFGKYMAYDLAATFIVCRILGLDSEIITNSIKILKLPRRRCDEVLLDNGNVLVNDYAHHPTEIKVTLEALKNKYPNKMITVVYQGHTYSRTNAFLDNYVKSLSLADKVYIMPTFSSVRENEDNPYQLLEAEKSFVAYDRMKVEEILKMPQNLVVFMGAGDIDSEFIFLLKK